MQNSLFFLRMGLYESRDVGACGPFTNSGSLQEIDTGELWDKKPSYKEAVELFREYARKNGVPKHNSYIKRFRLTGFAVLLSRDAIPLVAAVRCLMKLFHRLTLRMMIWGSVLQGPALFSISARAAIFITTAETDPLVLQRAWRKADRDLSINGALISGDIHCPGLRRQMLL